jgi:hypothetical protein
MFPCFSVLKHFSIVPIGQGNSQQGLSMAIPIVGQDSNSDAHVHCCPNFLHSVGG